MDRLKSLFSWLRLHGPRMTMPNLLANALLLVVWLCAPHQVPVIVYKVAAVLLAGCDAYMLDCWMFPYAKPSGYLAKAWREELGFREDAPDHAVATGCEALFIHATWRRTVIVVGTMLAVALAL